MCGIVGWICDSGQAPPQRRLAAMTSAIQHRGPDDSGHFHTQTANARHQIALGFRRLSIIDIAGGAQPMHDPSGDVTIIYNGEVYNFQDLRRELQTAGQSFPTRSDTEVILHAYRQYGSAFVTKLRGMFAIAIWDRRQQRLILARDPFGKKPLFLHQSGQNLFFASEIKSLLVNPEIKAKVNIDAVWDYLSYRYVPGPATLFEGITKLPPGSLAIWQHGRLSTQRYYSPPDARNDPPKLPPGTDPVDAFLGELEEAVRIRMIADVPVGAFLSGGIDSSAVVGLMTRHSPHPVKTFSAGFEEAQYSELDHAALIARQFGADHHELRINPNDLMGELPALVQFRDAPVAEPTDIPIFMLAREARKTVTVILTGEGADELLGGYPKHLYQQYAKTYQMLVPALLHDRLVMPLTRALPYRLRRAKTALTNLGLRDIDDQLPRWFGALSRAERETLSALSQPDRPALGQIQFEFPKHNSALRNILMFDQLSWLPDNLLERGDRMTMAASIEARMPFMDTKLADFISALPDNHRIRGNKTKWILRKAMERILPRSTLERPKVGFRVPVNEWFQADLGAYLVDMVLGTKSQTRDYYHPEVLRQRIDEHRAGRQNHEKLLWSILNLELFHRECLNRPQADTPAKQTEAQALRSNVL